MAGLLRREPLMAPWSMTSTPSRLASEPWISELLPDPATPVTTHSTPRGTSTSTFVQVVRGGAAHLQRARRPYGRILDPGAVVQVPAGDGVAGTQPVDVALVDNLAAAGAGQGAEVDDVVRDGDGLRFVLHHQDGVALVPQLQQEVVHPLDVVRVQADGGLVEDVGDVGERGAQVADHLGALRLAAGERAGGPVQGQVAQADFGEGVQQVPEPGEQRPDGGFVQVPHPFGEVADLHGAQVRDALALDLR